MRGRRGGGRREAGWRPGNVWADPVKDPWSPSGWTVTDGLGQKPTFGGSPGMAEPTGEGLGAGRVEGSLPRPGLGTSGLAGGPLAAGERPTYHDGWGPRQAPPIRQDGVPGTGYKYPGCRPAQECK